jgi:hypothetical protein
VVQGVLVDGPAAASSVDLALERDDDAVRLAAGAEPGLSELAEQQLVDAALRFADLDELVIAAIGERRGGPVVSLQRCAGAPARCTAIVEIGYADRAGLAGAVREAWQAAQGGALSEPPRALHETQRPAPESGCRWCRSPLVWSGVGAVVLGAVVAILAASGSKPTPVVTVHGRDF